ncbi:MAG: hypothetical protein R2709_00065 [Marmoricola sp.]
MAHTVWLGQHPSPSKPWLEVARDEAHVELTASAWMPFRDVQVIEALATTTNPTTAFPLALERWPRRIEGAQQCSAR